MRAWDAFTGLDSTVKNMVTSLRAVGELQNPAIRDRHWEQLMQATQVSIPTTQVSIPATQVSIPATRVSIPTTQVSIPTTKVSIPTTRVSIPTTQVSIPTYHTGQYTYPLLKAMQFGIPTPS